MPQESATQVAIIGAGAAGLATAIFTARRAPSLSICLIDSARRVGAKILVSGGGRCNVTNRRVTPADFNGTNRNIIRKVLAAFSVEETIAFFAELGVTLKEEEHGKLFPTTDQARTVLNALLAECERRGIRLLSGCRVDGLHADPQGWHIDWPGGGISAHKVVLATGGCSLPKTGSDGQGYLFARKLGHSLVEPTPALAPLVCEGSFHAPLSGISQVVEIQVRTENGPCARLSGALLWTHFGVSGPVVLDASRHWYRARLEGRAAQVTLNMLPGHDLAAAEQRLLTCADRQPRSALHNALAAWLPARVADAVLAHLGIPPDVPLAHLSRDLRRRLLNGLLAWPLPVIDGRGYAHAEVTAGGIPLNEIDPATMASRKCPGLYLAGEILDVDGRIGGFNFQWAWSSAYAAATGLAGAPSP